MFYLFCFIVEDLFNISSPYLVLIQFIFGPYLVLGLHIILLVALTHSLEYLMEGFTTGM